MRKGGKKFRNSAITGHVRPAPEPVTRTHSVEALWRCALLAEARGGPQKDFLPIQELSGVEVGVDRGHNAQFLLHHLPGLRLALVDPWSAYPHGSRYRASDDVRSRRGQAQWDEVYAEALARMGPYGRRARPMKTTSIEASSLIDDGSMDLVFIDGDHGYDAVREDICLWLPKLRTGVPCVFGGHDFSNPRCPDVRRAVLDWWQSLPLPNEIHVQTGAGYTWWLTDVRQQSDVCTHPFITLHHPEMVVRQRDN